MQPTACLKKNRGSPPLLPHLAVPLLLVLGPTLLWGEESNLVGKYVTIVSDQLQADQQAKLLETFEQAVPLWAERLGIEPQRLKSFHIRAFIFASRDRMLSAGVLPAQVPIFNNGIQVGADVWVIRGKTDYATTHLMMHEGVHAMMFWAFGGVGAGWFGEGVAELLATHRREEDRLVIAVIPKSPDESSNWGRIGVLLRDRKEQRVPAVERILEYESSATAELTPYAWSWALLMMLDSYPEYRKLWYQCLQDVKEPAAVFNQRFKHRIASGWGELCQRWRVWSDEIDYGFDVQRNQLPAIASVAKLSSARPFAISAAYGWQPVLVGLSAGTKLRIQAEGEVVLAGHPRPWRSECQGITLEYYQGHRLGELQAMVLDAPASRDGWCRPLKTESVGKEELLNVGGGVLLLRVNDFSQRRDDNQGSYQVKIHVEP
jgi:hypothetical protein